MGQRFQLCNKESEPQAVNVVYLEENISSKEGTITDIKR